MKKVLYLFGKFADQDIDWLIGAGSRQDIPANQVLIQEGKSLDTLYFTLHGNFTVTSNNVDIATIGAGEVVGELSALDSRPPVASVIATEDSIVLAISLKRLSSKLRVDTGFASRFYLALGLMLADRMRDTVHKLAVGPVRSLDDQVEEAGEISGDLLDDTGLAAARFEKLRQTVMMD